MKKQTVTRVILTDSYYTKPERQLRYSAVMDENIGWLRTRVQEYAGSHSIEEDAVIVSFEQVEASKEETPWTKQDIRAEDLLKGDEL